MKYYSEKLNKTFDTVEELEKMEQEFENDKKVVNPDRKQKAQLVEDAFAQWQKAKKESETKLSEIDDQDIDIDKKYSAIFDQLEQERTKEERELEKKYEEKYRNADKEREKEIDALNVSRKEILKTVREAQDTAENALKDFCKKYGTYHYSVNAGDVDLFPILFGFGQFEKIMNLMRDEFDPFKLF